MFAVAAEAAGGHAYVAGKVAGAAFQPELGATPLVSYGGEDAVLLKLVWGRAAARCFRGSVCEAGIASGVGLSTGDIGILSPTRCGMGTENAPGIPDTAADGRPSGLRQRLRWGNQVEGRVLNAQVGRYVLCWCKDGCEGAVPLEISVVFISGPEPGQGRTCVRGEFCDMTGTRSCGGKFAEGFPRGGFTEGVVTFQSTTSDTSCATVAANEMQFVSSNFGCERVTASAGNYKLCFCTPRGAGASCQRAYDFSFDIGTMVVQGPLRNQARKCVFGYRCWAEDIQGVGLADGDLILVLDKCRMPQTSPAAGNMTIRGIAGLTPGAGVPAYGKDGSQYLLAETVLAIAGTYRMCWCRPSLSATGCGITDSFAADIGGITVVTPALSLLRRCVRGQTCAIIDLEGFGLADGDAVHVLHFCPDKPNYGIFQEDVPNPETLSRVPAKQSF
ncbi:unnamed protein product [Polarella glacialis]|uniref:Uncharacterized protein n=1 Tax=Polarella glacialis TaxID=89957 RepID=A0A813K7Y4_POLGL|nr:unnamed protein product [Polarella glacialis]